MISNIKYELYQANVECNFTFMSYEFVAEYGMTSKINVDNYKMVATGQIKSADRVCDILNKLFLEFNSDSPRNFRSMSVSDVVIVIYTENEHIYTKAYYCDSFGWKELNIKEFLKNE